MQNQRNIGLDITRVIAILAVVMIHISAEFVIPYDNTTAEFFWGNVFDSISRIGVPLFVMISGSLMLDEKRNITIKKLLFKNIKSIGCLLLFWSVLYCSIYDIIFPLINGETLNLLNIIVSIIMGHYHMWYLYMMIGLYLVTPFLREFIKKRNKYLILLFVLVSILTQFSQPILNSLSLVWGDIIYITKFIEKFNLEFFSGYITYYILGWYLMNMPVKKKRLFYFLGASSLVIIILYVLVTRDYSNIYSEMNILVLLYSIAVFIGLNCEKDWTKIVDGNLKTIIVIMSKLSFGVYIIHPLFQTIVSRIFTYTKLPLIYIFCYYVTVIVLSFGSSYIASKIPIVRKLFRT